MKRGIMHHYQESQWQTNRLTTPHNLKEDNNGKI